MTPTLLPLYTFAKRLGLNPLHFMQVDANIGAASSRVCIHPIMQYSWQDSDGVSRDELSSYIYEAEEELAGVLGYWPVSKWIADERIELPVRAGMWFYNLYDARGDDLAVKTRYGQLISGGRMQKSLVLANQTVTYTDVDSDGYDETATITCVTTVTDPEEVCLYYPGEAGNDEWEIRPIQVTISAGTATIVCRREQLVTKVLLEALDAGAVPGLNDANFLDEVDVYRKYHDPSVQVQLVWRGGACCCSDPLCGGSCSLVVETGCTVIKDKELGLMTVHPATWDPTTATFSGACLDVCRRPDYVRMWYRSGYRDMSYATPNLKMDTAFELAICKLAVSKIDRNICSCKGISDVQAHWNTDLRRSRSTSAAASTFRVTSYELESCPFGSTIAALDVWRLVRRKGLGIPV